MRRLLAFATLALAVPLVACGDALPDPVPPAPSTSAEPEPGSAAAELEAFQAVLVEVDAAQEAPVGDEAVDALVEAGFDRSAIERTGDLDSLGEPVTLVEIAVRIGDECIVGQIGQGEPTSAVLPVLASGACLVGATVPVD